MASERIPFEDMNDHDLLVITAKTVNDMSLRLESYCRKVNEIDNRLRALEIKIDDDDTPNNARTGLSKKQWGILSAVVSAIIAGVVEAIRNLK